MKRGTPRHYKVDDLMRIAKVRRSTAVGWLELLWHATAEFAPQGNIGRCSDSWIEAQLDWSGKPGVLIQHLLNSGWLEARPASEGGSISNGGGVHLERMLLVHDWHDHADDSVRKRLQRAGLSFLTFSEKVTGQSTVSDRKVSAAQPESGSLPLPEPKPVPLPEPKPVPHRGQEPAEVPSLGTETPNNGKQLVPTGRSIAEQEALESFETFRLAAEDAGCQKWSDGDWDEAYKFCWKKLSFDQRLGAVSAMRSRKHTDDACLRMLPKNFLDPSMQRWTREIDRSRGSAKSLSAWERNKIATDAAIDLALGEVVRKNGKI